MKSTKTGLLKLNSSDILFGVVQTDINLAYDTWEQTMVIHHVHIGTYSGAQKKGNQSMHLCGLINIGEK